MSELGLPMDEEFCEGCGDGDKVPAFGYWRCPVCDAEWHEIDDHDWASPPDMGAQ